MRKQSQVCKFGSLCEEILIDTDLQGGDKFWMLVSIKLSNEYFISSQNSLTARFGDYYNLKFIQIYSHQEPTTANQQKRKAFVWGQILQKTRTSKC